MIIPNTVACSTASKVCTAVLDVVRCGQIMYGARSYLPYISSRSKVRGFYLTTDATDVQL